MRTRTRAAILLPCFVLAGVMASSMTASARATPVVRHLHFEYGPLDIQPGQNIITNNKFRVPQPKEDGWVVGFKPNLRLKDGTVPPVDVIHLHHSVWANASRRDATSILFPERFFPAGEEKTGLTFPPGYGYPYRTTDLWFINYMIHDLTPRAYRVWLTYDVDFVAAVNPPVGGMRDVHPIWMDVENGKIYPVFDALKGSGTNGTFTYPDQATNPYPNGSPRNEYTLDRDGVLVETFGHLHPGGLHDDISLVRDAKTAPLFRSEAHYYEPAGAVSWDVAMTATPTNWRVAVHAGDTLRITTTYDTSHASWYESMGLAVVWMYDGTGGTDPFATRVDTPGHLTHGHLPENRNHGGKKTTLRDPTKTAAGTPTSAVDLSDFAYGATNLSQRGSVPTVPQGQSITFHNLDAASHHVWHSITACQVPCTASTGIAYPTADATVQFDSGQLGDAGPPTSGTDSWSTPTDLAPGTYSFFCRVHPFMRGAFRVTPTPS
ncbi:MAG TPA: hypothetical protein VGA62_02225 [Acidimicrobiia bacterium]